MPPGDPKAHQVQNPRLMAFIVFAAIFMAVLDGNVVAIALPTITSTFNVDLVYSQWVVTAYLVAMTSLLLVFGRVSEATGKGRLFVLGFIVFTLGSLACGLSGTLPALILFRVIQATGAAMLFSISMAIIYQIYPKGEQGKSMGYIGTTVAIGSIAGPVVGGFVVDTIGWPYIFLINVPIGVVLVPLAMRYLVTLDTIRHPLRMDWPGAVTLVSSIVFLMLFLSEIAAGQGVTAYGIGYGVIFLASLAYFIRTERTARYPLLDLSVFRVPAFLLPNIASFLCFIALFMVNILGPFYFEGVTGLPPSHVGMIFLVMSMIMVVGSPLAGWLYDNHYSPYYSAVGMAVTTVSLVAFAFLAGTMDLFLIVLTFVPMSIGMVLFQSPNNTEIMSSLPAEKIATASSVSATVRNLGMALGVSFASILLTVSLTMSGYTGPVLSASSGALASAFAKIMVVSAIICLVTMGVCLYRAKLSKKATGV